MIAAARAKLPAAAAAQLDELVAKVTPALLVPEQPLQLLAKQMLGLAVGPLSLDESRPVVISAMAPLDAVEPLLVQVVGRIANDKAKVAAAMVRHRALVPSKDVAKTRKAIAAALVQKKLVDRSDSLYGSEDVLVRVEAGAGEVVATIVHGAGLDKLDAAARDRALGAKGWKPVLHPLVDAKEPAIARLHLRADRFAAVGPRLGAINIARAFRDYAS